MALRPSSAPRPGEHLSLFEQLNLPTAHTVPPTLIAQQGSQPPRIWTVKSLVAALTRHVEGGYPDVRVEGEISNCRSAPSGHLYFTLKDGGAQLACVIFRSRALLLKVKLQDGLRVLARGKVSVFESRGQMQLIADTLEPLGEGAIRLAYERLLQRLRDEGLFDTARKLPLPPFAANIGLITSSAGAVMHDVLNILRRRHRGMNVLIYPATVQGATAAAEFRAGLDWFQAQDPRVDVILLARGGGSLEDLHCFNDEALARAIAACSIPTISAIGHETDFTIADFAASLRAPTPSAAAEIITTQHFQLDQRVADLGRRLERGFRYRLTLARESFHRLLRSPALTNARELAARRQQRLDYLSRSLTDAQTRALARARRRLDALAAALLRQGLDRRMSMARSRFQDVAARLQIIAQTTARRRQMLQDVTRSLASIQGQAIVRARRQVDSLHDRMLRQGLDRKLMTARARRENVHIRLQTAMRLHITREEQRFYPLAARLRAISPQAVLDRGYALAYAADGRLLRNAAQLSADESVTTVLARGKFNSRVTAIEPGGDAA